jgi:hypothetical protein
MTAPAPVVLNFKSFEKNSLKGFFDLELASGMMLAGCTLHESHGKFWVGLPARPYATPDNSQSWVKIVDFRDKRTAAKFQEMAVAAAVANSGGSMSALDIVLEYLRRGWSPVAIPHRSKAPLDKGWPAKVVTEETAHQYFNGGAQNIGVRLGELSGGLADVDLDCPEAIAAAPYFLPRTQCFGRTSKPRSHWLYQSDLWQTEDKAALQFKFTTGKGKDRKEQMVLELRIGGGDKGAQTVFPGSAHETGEPIAWDEPSEITQADGEELKQRCARAASAALLAGHFPSKGARHDAGPTLGGFLARCGVSRPDTELFAEAVTIASGQPSQKSGQGGLGRIQPIRRQGAGLHASGENVRR